MHHIIDSFKQVYKNFDQQCIESLVNLYAQDIVFIDPFRQIYGRTNLKRYFEELNKAVVSCKFTFTNSVIQQQSAAMIWNMELKHQKLNSGKEIVISGASLVAFTDKITYHRDYFDAGALLYENVPVLGGIIKKLKAKI